MEWRAVQEFPAYQVSERGDVRRARDGAAVRAFKWGEGGKYWLVILRAGPSVYRTRAVNRLVAKAFIGLPPTPAHQAAHNDGDRDNNHFLNLRWATGSENLADRWRHGTMIIGRRNGRAVCDEAAVRTIRSLRESGVAFARIGKQCGISKRQVMRICSGTHWAHVA